MTESMSTLTLSRVMTVWRPVTRQFASHDDSGDESGAQHTDGHDLDLDIDDAETFRANIDLHQTRIDGCWFARSGPGLSRRHYDLHTFVEVTEAGDQPDGSCEWYHGQ